MCKENENSVFDAFDSRRAEEMDKCHTPAPPFKDSLDAPVLLLYSSACRFFVLDPFYDAEDASRRLAAESRKGE